MRPGIRMFRLLLLMPAVFMGGASPVPHAQGADKADVIVKRDLNYASSKHPSCTLDLALPPDSNDALRPAIVVIHGGGWIEGDKSSFVARPGSPANIIDLARLGFVSLSVNYRLSREAPYPAALDDCQEAIRWLRAHSVEYRINPQRIGAYGNSAGGHLALLLGLTKDALPPRSPHADQSSRVQAVVSDSGPIDLLYDHKQGVLRAVIEQFMGGPPDGSRRELYQQASPGSHTTAQSPPMLLIYGEADTQVGVRAADQFVSELGHNGHEDVTYLRLAKVGHCPHSLIGVHYLPQVVNDFFIRTLRDPAATK